MRPYQMERFWGFGAILMWVLLIALIALIVWVIVTLIRGRRGPVAAPSPSAKSSALAILEERYAKGEIDRDDYLQRKSDLQGR